MSSSSSRPSSGNERLPEPPSFPAPPPFLLSPEALGGPSSDLLDRLHHFLPRIREANQNLPSPRPREDGLDDDEQEEEEVIVLEEIEESSDDSSDEQSSDGQSNQDEEEKNEDEEDEVNDTTTGIGERGGLAHLMDIQGNSTSSKLIPNRPIAALPNKSKILIVQEMQDADVAKKDGQEEKAAPIEEQGRDA